MTTGTNGSTASAPPTLIVRVGAMGDVLHALPAVAALRHAWPEMYLGWVVDPKWRPLLSSHTDTTPGQRSPRMPLVDRCFLANTALWKRHGLSTVTLADIRQLARDLRHQRFSSCIDMQGSFRSAIIGRASGAARLVGNAHPRERPARWLYTERWNTPSQHVVQQGCELLGSALGLRLAPAPVDLPLDPESERWADSLRIANQRIVLLAPTAGWGAKQWPAERFGAVAQSLTRSGCHVLVNAASPHDLTAQEVIASSKGTAEQIVCSLAQLIALTRRLTLVIAGDTGPLHLAAALGIPVVALYGPTDPARTGPWSTTSRVLRDPTSITDHKRHRTPEAGLLKIEVEHVIDAAWQLLPHE